jgi:hypothetical protein
VMPARARAGGLHGYARTVPMRAREPGGPLARGGPPPALDGVTEAALLAAATMPMAVAAVLAWSFWPLAGGLLTGAIAAYRRRGLALALVAAVLAMGAVPVAVARGLEH